MTLEDREATREYVQTLLRQAHDRFLTIPEIHVVDLAQEVDRLRAQNTDLLQQINTDSDVMHAQRQEIEHYKNQIEEMKA